MVNLFQALYGPCQQGWLSIWSRQDKRTKWYPVGEWPLALEEARKEAKVGKDLYFGVGLREKKLGTWKRGGSDAVISIPALWVDIDIAGQSHKRTTLPPDLAQAQELIKEFPLEPSALVHSGYGLHGYWILREPWEFTSPGERLEAQELLKALEETIRHYAQRKGWDIDPVADLARVLRVPGTLNHKQEQPQPVRILELNKKRYNPRDFSQYLLVGSLALPNATPANATLPNATPANATPANATPANATLTKDALPKDSQINRPSDGQKRPPSQNSTPQEDKEDFPYGPAQLILENCAFIQYCQEKAQTLGEPMWYALVSNLARGQGGRDLVHGLSAPYPGYTWEETERKINQALLKGYPHTCRYIIDQLGFPCHKECPVTAPVGHCLRANPRAKKGQASRSRTQASQHTRQPNNNAQGQGLDPSLGPGTTLAPAAEGNMAPNLTPTKGTAPSPMPLLLKDIIADSPLGNLRLPPNWGFSGQGIWQQQRTRHGDIQSLWVCPVPLILTKRLQDIDTGEEKMELAYYRDKAWQFITAKRSTIFNRQSLVMLADKGLPVSSESAKLLVKYLDDLERFNLDLLPLTKSISRMGWLDKATFLPGASHGVELDVAEGSGEAGLAWGYQESGTMSQWVADLEPLRSHPLARFILAASFAAPLLKVFNQRVFFIHCWGPSRGGKTAALKAALSVWGEPEVIMASFNSTKVGLERMAAFYSDLPLGIDERQVVGDKQGLIESLVYMLGMGKGKTRGAKSGGTQRMNFWRTIVLTTGEEPLSSDSSNTGIKTRVIELYGVPLADENLARKIHDCTGKNFGTAGAYFIQRLISELLTNGPQFKENYQRTKEALLEHFGEKVSSHIDLVTTVAVADYYASQWIFQKDQKKAAQEGAQLAQTILGLLDSATDSDEGQRAYDYILSWYHVHHAYFQGETREKYGRIDQQTLYIYPTVFDQAMTQGGFNPNRILRDWAELGLIEVEIRGGEGKRRFKVRKWEADTQSSRTYVAVKLKD